MARDSGAPDLQNLGTPPERFVHEPTRHGAARHAKAATPPIGLEHLAGQHYPIRLQTLPDHEVKLV